MKAIVRILILPFIVLSWLVPTNAQSSGDRTYRVQFAQGQSAATLRGEIAGRETASYRLRASAGQAMTVSLSASNTQTYFNIYGPGRGLGDQAIMRSDSGIDNAARVTLPASGDYTLSVYLFRTAARRGETSRFTLDLAVRSGGATQLPEAPGAAAGHPATWRVTGLVAGDRLNVRTGPSASSAIVGSLGQGDTVRSSGCSVTPSGARWCRIEPGLGNSLRGWVSARYLQPARADGATQLPGVAPPPSERFNATGTLTCTISGRSAQCPWGVIRRGGGAATLVVTLPRGGERQIYFDGDIPSSENSGRGVTARYLPNGFIDVLVGTEEQYQLASAALLGG